MVCAHTLIRGPPCVLYPLPSPLFLRTSHAVHAISYGLYAAVMLCALVVSAIIGGALVEGMVWAAPNSLLAHDPVLQFTLMVESAVPSAINMLTLASMNEHFVSATSRLLFYSYIASAVTVPAAAVTYVVLLDK